MAVSLKRKFDCLSTNDKDTYYSNPMPVLQSSHHIKKIKTQSFTNLEIDLLTDKIQKSSISDGDDIYSYANPVQKEKVGNDFLEHDKFLQ